jgi:hypothetical protein
LDHALKVARAARIGLEPRTSPANEVFGGRTRRELGIIIA